MEKLNYFIEKRKQLVREAVELRQAQQNLLQGKKKKEALEYGEMAVKKENELRIYTDVIELLVRQEEENEVIASKLGLG